MVDLKDSFELRPFQKLALEILENSFPSEKHLLCIAPTGSGKSLIYEKTASLHNQRTLLITPLIALARQQFTRLKKSQIPVTLGAGTRTLALPPAKYGAWILSPEMLQVSKRQSILKDWKPSLLVVDECHCLWEWGDGFRPSFHLIPKLLSQYSISTSIWLTATLPEEGKLYLKKNLPSPLIEIGEFDLPSRLHLEVRRTPWSVRTEILVQWIKNQKGHGIVFVNTRGSTERLARVFKAIGKKVVIYHGGLSAEERRNTEELIQKQIPELIVCTTAFGMGMDYQHLRFVALWQAPTSILSLVQIIGRVGRNTQRESNALVLWDQEDFQTLEWTVGNSKKRKKELLDLLFFLSSNQCRRESLREYFNQISYSQSCQLCDVCNHK